LSGAGSVDCDVYFVYDMMAALNVGINCGSLCSIECGVVGTAVVK
jgi:hypothetical protein